MALLKCPECGHDVSDKASYCMNCGYPIQEYIASESQRVIEQPDIRSKISKCPMCAAEVIDNAPECKICGFNLLGYTNHLNEGKSPLEARNLILQHQTKSHPEKCPVCGNIMFDVEEPCEVCGYLTEIAEERYERKHPKPSVEPSVPRCPICGSSNLSKITNWGKAKKAFFFGVMAASEMSKTWKCNNCGSTF